MSSADGAKGALPPWIPRQRPRLWTPLGAHPQPPKMLRIFLRRGGDGGFCCSALLSRSTQSARHKDSGPILSGAAVNFYREKIKKRLPFRM